MVGEGGRMERSKMGGVERRSGAEWAGRQRRAGWSGVDGIVSGVEVSGVEWGGSGRVREWRGNYTP